LLETFVLQELKRQASWRPLPIAFHHFRDRDGLEVDIVLEQGAAKVAGVEVKAAATVSAADFRGLRKLKEAAGKRFAGGVVLYDGEASVSFGDAMHAVPIRALWEAL
jgi:predicted AAA+ superfamily ATPase